MNPIEMIWATVKQKVAKRNITLKLNDVKQLAIEEFDNITADNWKDRCTKVKEIEKKYADTDLQFDSITDLISMSFSVGGDSSSSDYSSTDTSGDDESDQYED